MNKLIALITSLCFVLPTLASEFVLYPADTNHYNTAFGGKLLAEMDRAAGIEVRRFLYDSKVVKTAVTIGINNIKFHKAAVVGDLLVTKSTIINVGDKTVTIRIGVYKEISLSDTELICSGEFVFCAYDFENKCSVAHGLKNKE